MCVFVIIIIFNNEKFSFSGYIWRCEECDPTDVDGNATNTIDPLDEFIIKDKQEKEKKIEQDEDDNSAPKVPKKWKFRAKAKVSYL